MTEQRETIRALTHLAGRAALDHTTDETLPCLVRNLSPVGAHVVFCRDVTIPDCFDLLLGSSKRTYRVRTVWHRANEAGIRFFEARENAPDVFFDGDRPHP